MAGSYLKGRAEEVKKKVSIPAYFYNIIIPQMTDYYSDYTVDFESKPVVKCCIHDEDTPSLRWYEETNTFFCFGCRAGGDIIELHRKFTEKMVGTAPSFEECVEFLYKYFIKGNDNQQVIVKVKGNDEEYKSDMKDIVRLSGYCTNLNGQLLVDHTLSEEIKLKIWKAIDDMNILISVNKVNAVDALNYIKGVVRESLK